MSIQDNILKRRKRDQWLPKIRASRDEVAGIEARRARTGLSLSAFMRAQALDGAIIQPVPLADHELLRHMAAVGNNLNQIARTANITGDLDARTSDRLRGALDALEGLIERLTGDR